MKYLQNIIFFILLGSIVNSQNMHYEWAKQYDPIWGELNFDADQNPYFTCEYSSPLTFEGDTFPEGFYTDYIRYAGLFLHFNSNGNYVGYFRLPYPVMGFGIDSENNHYYTGSYYDPIYLGGDTLISDGGHNAYVVQYDSSGNYKWHRDIKTGPPIGDCTHALDGIMDNDNNFIVFGEGIDIVFNDTVLYDNYLQHFFFAKYNINGELLWARRFGGKFQDVFTDLNNNIYIYCGIESYYSDSCLIDNDTINVADGIRCFVKLDPDGNLLWLFQNDLWFNNICVSKSQRGVFLQDFCNNDTLVYMTDTVIMPLGYNNHRFLIKYSDDGEYCWMKNYYSKNSSNYNDKITANSSGEIFITGRARQNDTIFFDDSFITGIEHNYFYTFGFIVKLDYNGNFQWGKVFDSEYFDGIGQFNIDRDDNLYLCYIPGIDFNGDTIMYDSLQLVFNEEKIVFLKLALNETLPDSVFPDIVNIYPNPTTGEIFVKTPYFNYEKYPVNIKIYDINGRITDSFEKHETSFTINISNKKAGTYFLRFENEEFKEVHKIMKD